MQKVSFCITALTPEDAVEAAGDPGPMRAVPEDAVAALAHKELLVVAGHAGRNPVRDRAGRHDPELPVALHAAALPAREGEMFDDHPELLLEREVRDPQELHAPVAHGSAFEEPAVAGQEDAPLLHRL